MKNGRTTGPSGIVAEMLKASSNNGVWLVADLANDTIRNGTIPSHWENSFIINIHKGKGDALIKGDYGGLKILDNVIKGTERLMEKIIRERVFIDDMQFDATLILRKLQEKHLAKNRKLHFAFVDLEKPFD